MLNKRKKDFVSISLLAAATTKSEGMGQFQLTRKSFNAERGVPLFPDGKGPIQFPVHAMSTAQSC